MCLSIFSEMRYYHGKTLQHAFTHIMSAQCLWYRRKKAVSLACGTQTVSLREAGCHCERWHGPLPNLQTNGASVGYVEICDILPACCAFLSTRLRSWSARCWSSWSSRNWEATLCIMAAATSLDRNSLTAWQSSKPAIYLRSEPDSLKLLWRAGSEHLRSAGCLENQGPKPRLKLGT